MIIAIDGPAGAGKTTTAKEFARKYGYTYIDTGAMYRATALYMLRHCITDVELVQKYLPDVDISFQTKGDEQKTILNGEDVTELIRTDEISQAASKYSAMPCVREYLLGLQRSAAKYGDIIMEGRDIGSVVFPNANLKIFLTAELNIRASRRVMQYWNDGMEYSYRTVYDSMLERDERDRTRETSPLVECEDAVRISTDRLDIDSVVSTIWYLAEPRKCLETAIEDFDKQTIEFQYNGGSGKLTPNVVKTMLHELSGYKELGITEYEVGLLLKSLSSQKFRTVTPSGASIPAAAVIPVAGIGVEIGPPEQLPSGQYCYRINLSDGSQIAVVDKKALTDEDGSRFRIVHISKDLTEELYHSDANDFNHVILKLSYYMTTLIGKNITAVI